MQIRSIPAIVAMVGLMTVGGATLALAQEDADDDATTSEQPEESEDTATESDADRTPGRERHDRDGDCDDEEAGRVS